MTAPSRLGPIKITLDEDAEPELFKALAGVPVKFRSRRMVALANLGAIVEKQGLVFAANGTAGITVPMQPMAGSPPASSEEAAPVDPPANSNQRPDAVEALGAGLDDFLTNLSGPLAA